MNSAYLHIFEKLAQQAATRIMDVRGRGFDVAYKDDASPVTEADAAAEAVILSGLRQAFPNIPIVAEEEHAAGNAPNTAQQSAFLLVDPLDGTREFMRGGEDFTVNIALIENGKPTVGVVLVPVQNIVYGGTPDGAWVMRPGHGRSTMKPGAAGDPIRIVASRSYRTPATDDWIAAAGRHECVSVGSSLKFCLLAEGQADVYPRFGRTMEWDTAAGDAIVRAVGGTTVDTAANELRYGKTAGTDTAYANPHFISYARAADCS